MTILGFWLSGVAFGVGACFCALYMLGVIKDECPRCKTATFPEEDQ